MDPGLGYAEGSATRPRNRITPVFVSRTAKMKGWSTCRVTCLDGAKLSGDLHGPRRGGLRALLVDGDVGLVDHGRDVQLLLRGDPREVGPVRIERQGHAI